MLRLNRDVIICIRTRSAENRCVCAQTTAFSSPESSSTVKPKELHKLTLTKTNIFQGYSIDQNN